MPSADRKTNDWGTFLGANLALEAQIGNTTIDNQSIINKEEPLV